MTSLRFRFALLFSLAVASSAYAVDVTDTRLLTQPAVSARRIAFVYAGDLWTCDRSGSNVHRVTADAGQVTNPVFSPDGSLIAFSAQYDGNTDVFVVSADGGVPTRLTFHPGADNVQAFTPDGKAVLFTSARAAFNNLYRQLFTVPVTGGVETPLPIPNASRATYAADDQHIAYTPLPAMFLEWKHYRGGTASRILLYRASDHGVDQIPQPSTRCNDVDPMWIGDTVYFRSDRDGEFNLYAYDTKSKAITPITHYTDFPVLTAGASSAAAAAAIVYEQAGYLHLIDLNSKQDTRLKVGVAADLVETRARFAKGPQYVRNAAISPSGARAVFEFRGEIVTVPAEKGDPRNLTNSVAVHDRSPAWSPDGKQIAYFSDDGGEYSLVIANQEGKSEPAPRKIKLGGAGFYEQPVWSPDSAKIAYQDNSETLFVLDVKSGVSKKIAQEPHYDPIKTMTSSWSPDSKWVAYTVNTPAMIQTVHVYSVDQDKSFAVTDGLSEVSQPVFDRSGKYLFFLGSTDAGPVKDWFAQSTADSRATAGIYVAVLRNDLPSPIAKESDEEKGSSSSEEKKKSDEEKEKKRPLAGKVSEQDRKDSSGSKDADDKDKDAKDGKESSDDKPSKPAVVRIDFDGLSSRIQDLPIPVGQYSQLAAGTEGQLYFLKTVDEKSSLQRFDLKTRKTEQVLPDVAEFFISANGKKMLYRTKGPGEKATWAIVALTPGKEIKPGDGKLAVDTVEVRVDPHAEWPQIFNEAWRINRDYFYAPNMHGVNWTAARDKYAAFLPDVTNRGDLSRVIQWMCSELSVGHHRGGGGDTRLTANTVPGGLLGADYRVENGRYRFAKIYGGLNWNPELRAPLTEPGVNAKVGEYLIAVNGRDLRAPTTNVYSLFENTSGKITEITIGPNADGSGSRTVQVVPIANEAALRNRDWVEGNLRKVEAATGGRVAYVYVPNTAALGYAYFKRYFYPQANRDAVIVDERFNAGGQVADYYIDTLRRPLISYWATRYGDDIKTPAAGIHGPKVMIADETAGSGGDLLPFMFRQAKLGPIVGKRTWGGLVGVLGFPILMDGGNITAPNLAIWTQDGWVVENEGVPPDIEVEQTPADVIAGHDPQLERAIAVVMDALKKDPPKHPTRPPYPVKVAPAPTSTGQQP